MAAREKARAWGRTGAVALPAAAIYSIFVNTVPKERRGKILKELAKNKELRKRVLKSVPSLLALGGAGYLLGRLAHYIMRGPSYEYASRMEDMYEKVAFNMPIAPPPAIPMSPPPMPGGGLMPNKTMLERNAMISVLGEAMSSERDPMRKRRLFEIAKQELGPYAMPLREKMMIT